MEFEGGDHVLVVLGAALPVADFDSQLLHLLLQLPVLPVDAAHLHFFLAESAENPVLDRGQGLEMLRLNLLQYGFPQLLTLNSERRATFRRFEVNFLINLGIKTCQIIFL